MKRILYVALAALVCGAWVSGAVADTFTEDFESYPDGPLPSPWYQVLEQVVYTGSGYGDPPEKGLQGSEDIRRGWNRPHAFRHTGGTCTQLSFKALFGYEQVSEGTVGLATDTSSALSGGTSSYVYAQLVQTTAAPWSGIALGTGYWDPDLNEGEGGWVYNSIQEGGMGQNQWYTIELTLTATDVSIGFYETSAGPPAYPMGSLPLPLGFVSNHLAASTRQQGVIDDIDITAGPTTLGNIDLTANLQDYTGDLSLMRMTIEVVNSGGATVQAFEVAPASTTVNQMVLGLPADTYSVSVRAPKWLSKTVSGIAVTPGNTTPVAIDLLNADLDGDNEVSTTDVSVGIKYRNEVGD